MSVPPAPIPYVDLAAQHRPIREELLAAMAEVVDSGQFVLGEQVQRFEDAFARLTGVRHAIGINSGTDALILALRVLGIGPGDEVITAPNSFVATASAIQLVGARTVFVDVGADYNLDPARLAAALTPRTRAIIPVHLTGRPCRMDPILALAAERGLAIIEDCAQAVLAEHRGRRVGSLGTIGCFSLHPLKTLNALGDGGVLTTDDAAVAEKLQVLRNIGLKTRDDCLVWSGNSRLDTLQAAILLVKLRHVEAWTETRRRHAQRYREELAGIAGVRVPPPEEPETRAVYHTFVIRADRRDELRAHLTAQGIGSAIHYPRPIHLMTAGRALGYAEGSFPEAERQAREIVSLPVHDQLGPDDVGRVSHAIRAFYEGQGRIR